MVLKALQVKQTNLNFILNISIAGRIGLSGLFVHSFGNFLQKPTERRSQFNHGDKHQFSAAYRTKACYSLVSIESLRVVNSRQKKQHQLRMHDAALSRCLHAGVRACHQRPRSKHGDKVAASKVEQCQIDSARQGQLLCEKCTAEWEGSQCNVSHK